MPDPKMFGTNLAPDSRRKLRLAAAYLGMAQNEFLSRALDESIETHKVPIAILMQQQTAMPVEVTSDESR